MYDLGCMMIRGEGFESLGVGLGGHVNFNHDLSLKSQRFEFADYLR